MKEYETYTHFIGLVCMYRSNLGLTLEEATERARKEFER